MESNKPINVIIPMGGLGSRFSKNGYLLPKPLVNILARPMISWLIGNLTFIPADTLYIALQAQLESEHAICDQIRSEFPNLDIRFTLLDGLTRGAAETLYKVTGQMTSEEQQRPTISLDCDTFYFSDVLHAFRNLQAGQGCCAYFEDTGDAPIFSYIAFASPSPQSDTHASPSITAIAEKVAISRHANTGAYGFPNATLLNKYVVNLLAKPLPSVGEFYTSALIASMLEDGIDFRGIHMADFECVGTPPQLLTFFHSVLERPQLIQSRTILLDLASVPALEDVSATTAPSDERLRACLPSLVFDMIEKGRAVSVSIKFSHPAGVLSEGDGASAAYSFVDSVAREKAAAKGMLVPIDDGLQKAVGYYL